MILPNLGTIIPKMGIADALFSPVQQSVLALLFGNPDRSYRGSELIALADSGTGAVHRQLVRLADSGLVSVTRVGNQKHYRANAESPVFNELRGLVVKTVGLVGPLAKALAPFVDRIRSAFVFGSVASGTDSSRSDIDLMVISDDLPYAELYAALQSTEAELARPIELKLIGFEELRRKLDEGSPFYTKLRDQPKIPVIGGFDGFS